jgi:DNA-binding protein HU-beta
MAAKNFYHFDKIALTGFLALLSSRIVGVTLSTAKQISDKIMNKAQLIVKIQKLLGAEATKMCAERSLDAVLSALKSGMSEDGAVQLVGFGTFSIASRKARKGINPQTKKPIQIPASKTVRFKPSAQLKDLCA